ncbi:5294_t:CDS:2 [Entrophospora sp. SA101]|nr:5294_t:CDS:2 [Entrophospora sp. SA101]
MFEDEAAVVRKVEELYSKIMPTLDPFVINDRVLVATIKALLSMNNVGETPQVIADRIAKYKFANIGGKTPNNTVSGRISIHFKRVSEALCKKSFERLSNTTPGYIRKTKYRIYDPDNYIKRLLDGEETGVNSHIKGHARKEVLR